MCLLALSCGQGVVAPAPTPNQVRLDAWRAARFGMFVHWGPVALTGYELSWSRGNPTPAAEYDLLYQQFNPVNFDADAWAGLARDAGMKYLVFTAKHHDGFCEFDTAQTDYNIMHSPFGRDVVSELAAACRRQGVLFGTYYSIPDWYNPDYCLTGYPIVQRETYDLDAYEAYLRAQVRELITNYGPLEVMWFDGMHAFDVVRAQRTVDYVRSLQPDILINNRCNNPGDFETPEQKVGAFQMSPPWESCVTIGTQWSWKPNDTIKSLNDCLRLLIRCAGGDGNLLLDVGPNALGDIEPVQAQRLRDMGRWLDQYGPSIYGTRGGPFKPNSSLVSTRRGNTIYVHLLRPATHVWLPPLPCQVFSASVLTGGSVTVTQRSTRIMLDIAPAQADDVDVIVQLNLDGDAMDLVPVDVPDLTVSIAPAYPTTTATLTAQAAGGIGSSGYAYEWARLVAGGGAWEAWGNAGATLDPSLTTKGEQWKVRACATDGSDSGDWFESAPMAILNAIPRFPTKASVSPASPDTDDDLQATGSGATDADGDSLTYSYEWRRSVDGGTTWETWGHAGGTLDHSLTEKGDKWQARSRVNDGVAYSTWWEGQTVTIGDPPVVPPTLVGATYVDATHVDALFSKAMQQASAETTDNYSIPYLTVGLAALQTDGRTVRLSTTPQAGQRTYTVFVSHVQDLQGAAIAKTEKASWSTPVAAIGAAYVDVNRADVLFNTALDKASAETLGNYSVPYLTLSAAALQADGKTVRLATTDQPPNRTFTVFVRGVKDQAGGGLARTNTASWNTPAASLTVASATDVDPTQVDVLFSEAVQQASAETVGNYSVPYLTLSGAALQGDGKTVRLTTTPQPPTRTFTVFVSKVKNAAGVAMVGAKRASWTTPGLAAAPALTGVSVQATPAGVAVTYSLSAAAAVEITVTNVAGRVVARIPGGTQESGTHTALWSGRGTMGTRVPGGRYLFQVTASDAAGNKTMALVPAMR